MTSSYLEGTGCELGFYKYNRDKKKGKTQIVFGLLCDANSYPIEVEVFSENTSNSVTLTNQIEKVRNHFEIKNVVWVTDRGILTNANINELIKPVEGLDYISNLTKPQIRKLAEVEVIQLGLFDELNIVEFKSEDYRLFKQVKLILYIYIFAKIFSIQNRDDPHPTPLQHSSHLYLLNLLVLLEVA